jgi:hypothetical protein
MITTQEQIEIIRQQFTQLLDSLESGHRIQQNECIGACAIALNTLANQLGDNRTLLDCIYIERRRLMLLKRESVRYADHCINQINERF